jgi:hypothetical protein
MFALAVMLSGSALTPARADVVVTIDKSSQRTAQFKPARPWRRPGTCILPTVVFLKMPSGKVLQAPDF